jgi:hypothetical protein
MATIEERMKEKAYPKEGQGSQVILLTDAVQIAKEYAEEHEKICAWKENDKYNNPYYETDCGNSFTCLNGDYQYNHFTHCPFCGGKIKDVFAEGGKKN